MGKGAIWGLGIWGGATHFYLRPLGRESRPYFAGLRARKGGVLAGWEHPTTSTLRLKAEGVLDVNSTDLGRRYIPGPDGGRKDGGMVGVDVCSQFLYLCRPTSRDGYCMWCHILRPWMTLMIIIMMKESNTRRLTFQWKASWRGACSNTYAHKETNIQFHKHAHHTTNFPKASLLQFWSCRCRFPTTSNPKQTPDWVDMVIENLKEVNIHHTSFFHLTKRI